ncbi:hypothetical protein GXB85_10480 [Cellulomonas sp. APG4]|uniref:hypothetical protein n=1 Tax=Cellulomonas sp. APG4 TaxID=1538656 RepID=UPI00137AADFA|nr:hypothetical protein [Cellulomonas sp. APG4]NCT91375.1 hypothetical protein [Cellulomonas sp. APG4]
MTTTEASRPMTAGRTAAEPVSPAAVRLRRPGWRDPRLLVGLVLLGASVVLGSFVVSSASRTVPVLVADEALVPGQQIDPGVLVPREVRLHDVGLYLPAGVDLDGLVAVRAVAAGELVPRSALARDTELDLRPVAITPEGPVASGVVAGAAVDLWFVPAAGRDGGAVEPRPLAEGLTVAEVTEAGRLAVGSGVTVHVLVDLATLPHVLAALAEDGSVEIVHVPGGLSG